MDDTTKELLRGLLSAAAAAHGVYEAEELSGVYDDEWPEWYAEHMALGLAELGYRVVLAGR